MVLLVISSGRSQVTLALPLHAVVVFDLHTRGVVGLIERSELQAFGSVQGKRPDKFVSVVLALHVGVERSVLCTLRLDFCSQRIAVAELRTRQNPTWFARWGMGRKR